MDSSVQSIGDLSLNSAIYSAHTGGMRFNQNASMASIEASAKDFEAMFMSQMLQPMWEGVEVNSMFGGGHGEEVMREILIQEYGKSMANVGGFGLSDAIKNEMIKIQQMSNGSVGGTNG